MEPHEIFQLIVKADEALKYATEEKGAARRKQAREHLEQARAEAEAIGNAPLVAQADQRLADLAELETGS
jgi:riboflavin biosynthesis pyrimidine reductase